MAVTESRKEKAEQPSAESGHLSRRRCSIEADLEIAPADSEAWERLRRFHYRCGRAGAIDRIFALRQKQGTGKIRWGELTGGEGEIVGVIVYAMPLLNVGLRNVATGGRYTGLCRGEAVRLLNREVRCISRVVIHPQYRGIGLARRLVRETLNQAGTELVEAQASMGRVNPFFERAGMRRYDGPMSERAERLSAALEHAGIGQEVLGDAAGLKRAVGDLSDTKRQFVMGEMERFAGSYGRSSRNVVGDAEKVLHFVVKRLPGRPVYYLWQRGG